MHPAVLFALGGAAVFYGTGIPAAILFINKNKADSRRGKLLIVNGDKDLVEGKNQNSLSNGNVTRLASAVHSFEDTNLFCRVVDLTEIAENDYNLNITRYIQTDAPPDAIDVPAEIKRLRKLTAARDEAEDVMNAFLDELGYGA